MGFACCVAGGAGAGRSALSSDGLFHDVSRRCTIRPMADIDVLLQENRKFPPSAAFRSAAIVSDPKIIADAERDPDAFWESEARKLDWFAPWTRVLDWTPPFAKWFVGGRLNVSYNCLDRHIPTARRNKAALIWEGEPGDRRTLTYWDLYVEVQKFANVL